MKKWIALLCLGLMPMGSSYAQDQSSVVMPAALNVATAEVLLVDFWASWCVPCRASFPWMNEMQRRYGDAGLRIVGINVDKERGLADQFLQATPASFEIMYDPQGVLARHFQVPGMPSAYLLGANGRVIHQHIGFRRKDAADYEAAIRAALAQEKAR